MEVCYDASTRKYTGTLFVSADVESVQYSPAYAYFGLRKIIFEEGSRLGEIGEYALRDT